jgi:hydrogenase maturation protease
MTRCEPNVVVRAVPRIVVIGVGNIYRGDDAVGLLVVQRVRERLGPIVEYREEYGEGTALIDVWKDADAVILIDAARSGALPGTIHRFDVAAQSLPETFQCYSTHAFGVAEAIELARALGQMPAQFIVYGIEGKNFAMGTELSVEMENAIERAVEQVCLEVEQWRR